MYWKLVVHFIFNVPGTLLFFGNHPVTMNTTHFAIAIHHYATPDCEQQDPNNLPPAQFVDALGVISPIIDGDTAFVTSSECVQDTNPNPQ